MQRNFTFKNLQKKSKGPKSTPWVIRYSQYNNTSIQSQCTIIASDDNNLKLGLLKSLRIISTQLRDTIHLSLIN